jgi:hypothetical protein
MVMVGTSVSSGFMEVTHSPGRGRRPEHLGGRTAGDRSARVWGVFCAGANPQSSARRETPGSSPERLRATFGAEPEGLSSQNNPKNFPKRAGWVLAAQRAEAIKVPGRVANLGDCGGL